MSFFPAAVAKPARRLFAPLLLCALLSAPPAAPAGTIGVEHALGATEAPVNPKRIVAFDLSVLDSIDALGITGLDFAVPKQAMPAYLAKYGSDEALDAGGMKEPNLEKIYEFRPDVIFISARQADYHDRFSEIAPTIGPIVDYRDFMPTFRKCALMLGDLFQVPEAAREQADAIEAKAAAVAAKAAAGGRNGLIVMVNDGAVSVYGPGSRFGMIHDILGVPPADPGVEVSTHGQSVDFEYLARIDPDILFVINRNAAIGADGASAVLDNELILGTKAGRNGRIVRLDSAVWYLAGAGLESLAIMMDEVDRALD